MTVIELCLCIIVANIVFRLLQLMTFASETEVLESPLMLMCKGMEPANL
jgi:hypothetical protein